MESRFSFPSGKIDHPRRAIKRTHLVVGSPHGYLHIWLALVTHTHARVHVRVGLFSGRSLESHSCRLKSSVSVLVVFVSGAAPIADDMMPAELADCLRWEVVGVKNGVGRPDGTWCVVNERCTFTIRLSNLGNSTTIKLDPGKVIWRKYPKAGARVETKTFPPPQYALPPRKGFAEYKVEFTPDTADVVNA
jgi:hypothetical protein